MSRKNGGIIGPANTPVGGLFKGVAGGVWRMNDVANFVGNSQWPTGPQSIDNSLRFNSGSSDYLNRTPGSTSDTKTWTWSGWLKFARTGVNAWLFGAYSSASLNTKIYIDIDNNINVHTENSTVYRVQTDAVLRDFSAWYNVVVAFDTTQGTEANRIKIYINGTQQSLTEEASGYPTQNWDGIVNNSSYAHNVGYEPEGSVYFDGYMAEVVFIDGQALDQTSFGEFDTTTGIWKPKKIGSFTSAGTNSFYLDFKDSSNVGKDASGLSNNFTVNNLTSIDQSTDTCVVNYATGNPLIRNKTYNDGSLAEGNTYFAPNGRAITCSTIGVTKGKWYAEFKAQDAGALSIGVGDLQLGIQAIGQTNPIYYDNNPSYAIGYYNSNGNIQYNTASTSYGNSYADNDIIGVALDMDNYALYFSKNGVFQNSGDPTSGSSKTGDATSTASYNPLNSGEPMFFFVEDFSAAGAGECFLNFGSPSFSISSGNSDANGFGNFEYSVPSGYYALNTSNLNTYG
jgi:hypothetical protein